MMAMCWGKVHEVCKVENLMLYQERRTRYRLSLKSKALHYPMKMTNLMLFILKLAQDKLAGIPTPRSRWVGSRAFSR
jgi:hypothetical protein